MREDEQTGEERKGCEIGPNVQLALDRRKLPPLLRFDDGRSVLRAEDWPERRGEILESACRLQYGQPPATPESIAFEVEERNESFFDGKAILERIRVEARMPTGTVRFGFLAMTPKSDAPVPAFVSIGFHPDIPNAMLPARMLCEAGVAVAHLHYLDVTGDDGDFSGNAGLLTRFRTEPPSDGGPHAERAPDVSERAPDAAGKLAIWAWAASRLADWLQTRPDTYAQDAFAVIGHSRLGKTALLAGALDERFHLVVANNSGCIGASLCRGKEGETATRIGRVFPFWFAPNFAAFADREEDIPFDQHHVLALVAPRRLAVGCAEEDQWADPASEYLASAEASVAWKLLGVDGLRHPDRLPETGEAFVDGAVAYHLRAGGHDLLESDWKHYAALLMNRR